jgi:hypothetical protein
MFLNYRVSIPSSGKVSIKKKTNGDHYVYYQYENNYSPERKYNLPKRTTIGKVCQDDSSKMFPNPNYLKFFPDATLPEYNDSSRSSCLKVGTYVVLNKIIHEYHLQSTLESIIGEKYGLFLDLVAYTIICENNASQYYPEYAYNHPLFTRDMKIYSDSSVSNFLHDITVDDSVMFLNDWNSHSKQNEKIYISYDSTNKKSQAGDVDIVEVGHSKTGLPDTIFNESIAYDRTNRKPLFYESYSGSITDISQLKMMVDKSKSFGYKKIGFILDRGYFSETNIHYMDSNGYSFIVMLKGMKQLVRDTVLQVKGTFEEKWDHIILEYEVNGITVEKQLFQSDENTRYIHVYYSSAKAASEKMEFTHKLAEMEKDMKKSAGNNKKFPDIYDHYYDLVYWHEGKEDQKFVTGVPREEVIEEELKLMGYFCVVTSEKMDAKDALLLYKSRDDSEKLFRGDKSYLGERAERVYTEESYKSKIFIEFIALIVRSKIYVDLIEQMKADGKRYNYMTVPAAIRELEKIEMIKYGVGDYQLDHALTKTQKTILKAFGIDQRKMLDEIHSLSVHISTLKK